MTPTLDVNRVLQHPRFRTAVTLYRRAYTIDEHGRGQVTESDETIGAVVRPASQDDLERIPEGDRDRGFIKVLSETPLSTGGDDAEPDEIAWAGRRWMVYRCDPWMYGRCFWSAICELKAEQPGPEPDPEPTPEPEEEVTP